MDRKIAFIGAGSLAEALIAGIIKAEVVVKENIYVTNKDNTERLAYIQDRYQVQCSAWKEELTRNADIIILAMKPHDAKASLASIKSYLNKNQLIISAMAGITATDIEHAAGLNIPVVRVMPNTSALIGSSATAISPGSYANEDHIQLTDELFQTVGITKIVDEKDMHTVTAISGSGPAYIYYLVEALEKAAIEAGLDHNTASELIAQTVIGAGEMLQQSGEKPAVLRKNITSPGGTTEAGINDLKHHGFQEMIASCVNHARNRSIDLGKN
ncbi:pyrroline-5-carboxylate reductase [Oceanobacillus massiliensis]|uniref:pyrroline-5-carboxylate reductase n=1 Tax=Oceanobacillus massiliensis TaxID=1465765 RepID=UPI000289A6E6|nr:pyrroline-5-carboxylate reductase [Oceanobacillus massiliensis]